MIWVCLVGGVFSNGIMILDVKLKTFYLFDFSISFSRFGRESIKHEALPYS